FDEALRLIKEYERPSQTYVKADPKPCRGCGASEAPRGLIYHRYEMDGEGLITSAKIVPPTSQNQKIMEDDLRKFVTENISLPKEKLVWKCEQIARNYDPCISCATHFIKLKINGR
ncbi:MAG: nickel-dependent hydrogenase large subunit, partial [Elusimicrobia bacterium]|nr:nickel-dependent hydrogenase large subunit [Elusimicrobiota bacterium]